MDDTYNLHYSLNARQDLAGIWDYVMLEFSDVEAAERITDNIMGTIEKLRQFPRMGPSLSSITGIASDYRFMVTGRYMVFYRVEERDIYVDRILHGKQDYLSILFGERGGGRQ